MTTTVQGDDLTRRVDQGASESDRTFFRDPSETDARLVWRRLVPHELREKFRRWHKLKETAQ